MIARTPVTQDEAKRIRAELRLALAQADELLRRAEAILVRNRSDRTE